MIWSVEPLHRLCLGRTGPCSLVQILDDLVLTVGGGEFRTSPRRVVKFYSIAEGNVNPICEVCFETSILNVRITAERFVVVTESEIHVYQTQQMVFKAKIAITPNPKGLCDLSCDMVLAYPNSRGTSKGNVVLYNLLSLQQKRLIEGVHDHPLSYIQFSSDGRYVATTSECGTLVRVTQVSQDNYGEEETIYSFRRGTVSSADISSIAFTRDNRLLAVSSTNGTVHIFDLELEKTRQRQPRTFGLGSVTGMFVGEETKSFCTIPLPVGTRSIIAFSNTSKRLYTITQDGKV
eukprot:TRINITY_DN2421_c0_g2_i18.p1 TRINITY_DN2421_c0_g2~~TRINITY_DN2421_c0_g2_i18.p1  ORF type:complete len:291 (-),score=41.46 TRINITY_DN2421_c0_g2_i18:512-1384(-)